jgi:hypothetical protein
LESPRPPRPAWVDRTGRRAENVETVHECRQCGQGVADRFRYCPWCAQPQRAKVVEFFAPHPSVESDAHKALRVSRYFGSDQTPAQFRFSIWDGESATGAVSLTDAEAARLAGFVAPQPPPRRLLDTIRDSLHL